MTTLIIGVLLLCLLIIFLLSWAAMLDRNLQDSMEAHSSTMEALSKLQGKYNALKKELAHVLSSHSS